jgi:hypothetical protein
MFRLTPKYFIAVKSVTCGAVYMYYQYNKRFVLYDVQKNDISGLYNISTENENTIKKECNDSNTLDRFRFIYRKYGWILYKDITMYVNEQASFETFTDWAEALNKKNEIAIKLDQRQVLLRDMVFKIIGVVMKTKSKEDLDKLCNFMGFENAFYTCLVMDREKVLHASVLPIWASIEDSMKISQIFFVTIDPRYMYVIKNNERFHQKYQHLVIPVDNTDDVSDDDSDDDDDEWY